MSALSESVLVEDLVHRDVRAPSRTRCALLRRFLLLNYVLMLVNSARFLERAHWGDALGASFVLTDFALYPMGYVLVALGPLLLAAWIHERLGWRGASAWAWVAVPAMSLVQFVVHCDVRVVRMYGFHINSFVWNLITVPGGIESMDAGDSTRVTMALEGAALLLLEIALWRLAASDVMASVSRRLPRLRWIVAIFVLLLAFERMTMGLSDAADYRPVVTQADLLPFRVPIRMHSFAESIGLEAQHGDDVVMDVGSRRISYPRSPLERAPGSPVRNVLWLVSESWRADMLDPEIMPATSAFAVRSLDFRRHYSGGNGTRMGMFSMFYGLYGSSWFPFLAGNVPPALLELMRSEGWSMQARTSARFSFPEFDETIFVNLPAGSLVEGDPDLAGWQNDRRNVGELLDSIDARDPDVPFFRFMFFESPHARYDFPEECAIRRPYLEDMNYATLDPEHDIDLIFARYVNACRHLDTQFARIFEFLDERGLLDDTIVVLTGDHGEEFMENGRWGHHSDFGDAQIRVPFVLHAPGLAPRTVYDRSSHLDIVPTLAGLLSVVTPVEDHSLGRDLLDGGPPRTDCVVADWDHLALMTDRWKAVFPTRSSDTLGMQLFTAELEPVDDPSPFWSEQRERVTRMLAELGRFSR
ncbi:MAG: sulfatase-like hydrolase/transferase [Planctomycetes bacterium]|nr:sulfatase-like hydrolase/transferase [Planctomycetota bacterium]